MPHDHSREPATAPPVTAEAGAPEAAPAEHSLDAVIGGGTPAAIARVIAAQPASLRDASLARVHELRGNRVALEVEGRLMELTRDPLAPVHGDELDLVTAKSYLLSPSLESSRTVFEMLRKQRPEQIAVALMAFDRAGLLENFLAPLPFAYVEALDHAVQRLPGTGHVQSLMRPHYQDRDRGDNSLSGTLEAIPYVGGALTFAADGLTFGFVGHHDAAYRAKRRGLLTEDEYVELSNNAGARATAVAVTSLGMGGAAAGYVEGATAELAIGGTAGRMTSTTLTGMAGGGGAGLGAQLGADLSDGEISGPGAYARSTGTGMGLGAAGGAVAGAVGETAQLMSPAWQERLARLATKFPGDAELFEQFRAAGQRHAIKIKAWRLDRLLGDGAAKWANPELAMATAGVAPDVPVRITGELTDDGITVMHAERLPDAEALGDALAPAAEHVDIRPNARDARLQELSRDGDRGFDATTVAEAEAGLGLEEAGLLPGPIRRPRPGDGHSGDFVDGAGRDWDVKAPRSRQTLIENERARAAARGRSPPSFGPDQKMRGEFRVDQELAVIRKELAAGESVIIDTRHLTSLDREALRQAIFDAGVQGNVRFYPP